MVTGLGLDWEISRGPVLSTDSDISLVAIASTGFGEACENFLLQIDSEESKGVDGFRPGLKRDGSNEPSLGMTGDGQILSVHIKLACAAPVLRSKLPRMLTLPNRGDEVGIPNGRFQDGWSNWSKEKVVGVVGNVGSELLLCPMNGDIAEEFVADTRAANAPNSF